MALSPCFSKRYNEQWLPKIWLTNLIGPKFARLKTGTGFMKISLLFLLVLWYDGLLYMLWNNTLDISLYDNSNEPISWCQTNQILFNPYNSKGQSAFSQLKYFGEILMIWRVYTSSASSIFLLNSSSPIISLKILNPIFSPVKKNFQIIISWKPTYKQTRLKNRC